jgi:hypothetical protein
VRVAVVGGGLFGATTAVELARSGANVTLYERHDDLLMGATRANQGRIHRGYHYPRDPHAGELSQHAERFYERFYAAIERGNTHRYLIADDSKVDPAAYQRFCRSAGLDWEPSPSPLALSGTAIAAPEAFLDVRKARAILRRELSGVDVRCNAPTNVDRLAESFEHVIDATYGRYWPEPLDYEVCETVLIELGPQYLRQSFVVMDGPYVSLDPHGRAHMLYDVTHSVHAVNEVPEHLSPLLDRGPVYTEHTRVAHMLATARRFLRDLGNPLYRGSLFTIRAVLPDDGTDARPTLLHTDGNITRILAGKLCTAPWAAEQVVSRLAAVPA